MSKKRLILYLAAAFVLPIVFILFRPSIIVSNDKPRRWSFFRALPLEWDGPAQNASSADFSALLTLIAEDETELDLAGATSTTTPDAGATLPSTQGAVSGIAGQDARCRYGPSTSFHALTYLQPGDAVLVLARSSAADWLRVETQSGELECWVFGELLVVDAEVASLLVDSGPPPPTATPTETPRLGCWVENDPQYPNGICTPLPCGPNDFPATACELP